MELGQLGPQRRDPAPWTDTHAADAAFTEQNS